MVGWPRLRVSRRPPASRELQRRPVPLSLRTTRNGGGHYRGGEGEDHLGADLDNVLPQQEECAAQLARRRNGVLGVELLLLLCHARREKLAVDEMAYLALSFCSS